MILRVSLKKLKIYLLAIKKIEIKKSKELKVKLDELKKTIEENQNNYTQILNKASESINSFITKAV